MGRPCKCCGKTITEPSEPCGFCPCYDVDNPDIYEWVLAICFFDVVQINDDWDIYIGKYGDDQEDLSFIGSVSGTPVEGQDCRCFIFATSEDLYRQNGDDIVFEVSEECSNSNFCSVIENVNIVDSSLFEICDNVKIRFNRSNDNGNGSAFTFQLWRKGPIDYIDENGETQTKTGYCQLAYDVIGAPTFPGVHGYTIDKPIYQSCCPIYCQEKVCSCYNFDDPNFEDPNADPDCVGRYPVKVKDFYAEASNYTDSISAVWHTEHEFNTLSSSSFMAHSEFTISGFSALNRRLDLTIPVYPFRNPKTFFYLSSGLDNCPLGWDYYGNTDFESVMATCAQEYSNQYDFCSDPYCQLWLLSSPVPITGNFMYKVFSREGDYFVNREYRYIISGYADYTGNNYTLTGSEYPKSKEFSINNHKDPVSPTYRPAMTSFKLIYDGGFIETPEGVFVSEGGGFNDVIVTIVLGHCKFPSDDSYTGCKCTMKERIQQDVDVGINYDSLFPSWWWRPNMIFGYIGGGGYASSLPLIEAAKGNGCLYDYSTLASTIQYDCKKMANLESSIKCDESSITYDLGQGNPYFSGYNYYMSTGYTSNFKLFRNL